MTDKAMIIRKIPEYLHRALKVQAAKEGRSMAEIIIGMIKLYVEGKK